MSVLAVIPARYASTRLPAKPLHPILGKPMLQWVVEGAQSSQWIDQLVVATDHPEIESLCKNLGVSVQMTEPSLPSGSDRVWAVAQTHKAEVVLNIQGDEPLVTGTLLDQLIEPMLKDSSIEMATVAHPIRSEDLEDKSAVKVILNQNSEAIYFSRFAIPYSRLEVEQIPGACLKHIGLYAYRSPFLARFCGQAPVDLERGESLEQLRALFMGARIKVIEVEQELCGVDTIEDVKKMEAYLRKLNGD